MTRFACVAIAPGIAARFRETGRDDRGNALVRMTATDGGGFPCRVCLRLGREGEEMLLGSYDLPRPLGIYWTPSPIFVHAEACTPYAGGDEVVEIVRENAIVSVRAYDARDMVIYDLGRIAAGEEVEGALANALGDPRTAFVNIHTARPGCLLCRVEKLSGAA